jgi:hypothetical protein
MEIVLAYDHRTTFAATSSALSLDFATNLFRKRVAFQGRVLDPYLFGQMLQGLYRVAKREDRYQDDVSPVARTIDPVVTVQHDELFFEAFSNDQSSYVRLSAPLTAFESNAEIRFGTTNIDFTRSLGGALQNLRSSRRTDLHIGSGGLDMASGVEAAATEHIERRVEVSDEWVQGFLQVQGALTMPAYSFDVRPADLLSVIAYFRENRPPSPPHGLRFELKPNAPITAVLEPWERRFSLRDTQYSGYERTVRLWGRKRLELLGGILPFAHRIRVTVLGRALPHMYTCFCGPFRFLLVLSGWTGNDWARDVAFDLMAAQGSQDADQVERVHAYLSEHLAARPEQIAADTGLPQREVEATLFQLCRAGRAMVDPNSRQYRLRELFAMPLDLDQLFAPDPRVAAAKHLVAQGSVTLGRVIRPEENYARPHETRAEATVRDGDASYDVIVAVDGTDRLRFGRCGCPLFVDNMMSLGPCVHIQAARLALAAVAAPAPATSQG